MNKICKLIMEYLSKLKMDKDEKYNEKALELFNAKKYEKALKYFNKAICIKNDKADYYRNRGYCYYEMKQFELGDKDFDEASMIAEIENAFNSITDRFFCYDDYEKYKQILIRYKNDPRFAKRIQDLL